MKTGTHALSLAILFLAGATIAQAQSSLGIGAAEQTVPSGGMFPSLLQWINQQQQSFYRALTEALSDMRSEPAAAWILIGLSFAYGVFHAAGPGHGKAVISSYMLANEVALRRGIVLSFLSAFAQAVTAVLVVGAIFLFLRGSNISQTDAVWSLEVTSYAIIALFGAWLLIRKLRALRPAKAAAPIHSHCNDDHSHHSHGHHDHAHGETCSSCGHSHMPDPARLGSARFRVSEAVAAVIAVGLRPCSGALIVLTFAFLNGLWWAGIASAFAMAAGTAITVSALATLAVTAKNTAVRFSGDGRLTDWIHHGTEIAGALLVFLIGSLLFMAALQA